MKRENILITENRTEKRVAAVKFVAPGDVPAFECSIHFGEENDVTMQNCIIKGNHIVKCSPDDTYDFETGALIALMKMCGFDKSYKAIEEAFKYNSYDAKKSKVYEEKIHTLEKEKEQIIVAKNVLYNRLEKENKELHKNIDELFKDSKHAKSEVARLSFEKHRLEEKVEKLKLDCEKLQNGYLDTDMIFCGGRQNGKQYTLLVNLFKKIPQNKVDEAYKEAYNTKLPVWQREFLKEALSIYKPPTKREKMWNDILSCGDVGESKFVNVKKENLSAFLKDAEAHGVYDLYGDKMSDSFKNLYFYDQSVFTFQILRKPAGFVASTYCYVNTKKCGAIDYLPPMRWDLFEKGRRIIRVNTDKLDEFITKCTNKFGSIMKPVLKRYKDFTHIFVMISDYHYDNKPTIHIMEPEDLVRNQHENPNKYSDKKIVDWEDVR